MAKEIPSIDLHPEKIPGPGPEAALAAAKAFLSDCLRRGAREARLITGLGMRGDGTPRLRGRVEAEVLSAFGNRIESQYYEQGGAVIRVQFKAGQSVASRHHLKNLEKEKGQREYVDKEERLMVMLDRLEACEVALEEGDLRRARLKLNQLAREFGENQPPLALDEQVLTQVKAKFKKQIDALL